MVRHQRKLQVWASNSFNHDHSPHEVLSTILFLTHFRVGGTMMNSFLFNSLLILLASPVVVQFCSKAFSLYNRFTGIDGRARVFVIDFFSSVQHCSPILEIRQVCVVLLLLAFYDLGSIDFDLLVGLPSRQKTRQQRLHYRAALKSSFRCTDR